ncbi:hypothetical protein IIA79_02945 [bacterium]|nr:hypothetical protein [bacterium]
MKREQAVAILAALGWLLFFLLTIGVRPGAGEPHPLVQVASVLLAIAILAVVLLAGERARWPVWTRWAMFGAGVLLVLLAYSLNLHGPMVRAFTGLGILMIALPVGYWIGDRMEKVTNLVPLAVAMSFADIFSVYQGPTKRVAEDLMAYQSDVASTMAEVTQAQGVEAAREAAAVIAAPLADYIMVYVPIAGTGAAVPILGIGDFIVLAFIFRAVWLHNLKPMPVLIACLLSLVAALATSQVLHNLNPSSTGVPALPFIALGAVGYLCLAEERMRRLDRQEVVLSILVAAVFSVLILGKWLAGVLG